MKQGSYSLDVEASEEDNWQASDRRMKSPGKCCL